LIQHLPFVVLNTWDKVMVAVAKISVNTSNIESAENNQWDAVNVELINLVLRTLKKLIDDIKEYAYNDTVLPASKAPSWMPIHFNRDKEDLGRLEHSSMGMATVAPSHPTAPTL
jgi:hypothetical protein